MDDWDFPYIGAIGSTHDLRDADHPEPSRLYGLRSVSRAAEWAYRQAPAVSERQPIGFSTRGR